MELDDSSLMMFDSKSRTSGYIHYPNSEQTF